MPSPNSDEIEISVFGPGYGEAIACHVGDGRWMVIDSCLTPKGVPAVLEYFDQIKIEPTAIERVIVTHWHGDHTRGLSKLVEASPKAKFVCSSALFDDEFLAFSSLQRKTFGQKSPTYELAQTIDCLTKAGRLDGKDCAVVWASPNKRIWKGALPDSDFEVFSLSPSEAATVSAFKNIAKWLPMAGQDRLIPKSAHCRPNQLAVVLWCRVGTEVFLLGADLEQENNPTGGWQVIVDSGERPALKGSSFKVPHHGSSNGHYEPVWEQMLNSKPLAVVTPFVWGKTVLPTSEDIQRIGDRSSALYSTADPKLKRSRSKNGSLNKMIHESVRSIHKSTSGFGHVRLRRNRRQNESWRVECFGDACRLA